MYAALAKRAEEAVVETCWRQWSVLVGEGSESAIIDPEALVLTSLCLRRVERRLADRLLWWASKGAKLLSVQRLTSLAALFPAEVVERGLPWFAAQAVEAGDSRWKRLAAKESSGVLKARGGKGPERLELFEPATLLLRLRAGFGVGAKADLMALLIGVSGPLRSDFRSTASELAGALSYSVGSVRRAAGEMLLAGFVQATASRPPVFSVERDRWAELLGLGDTPLPWNFSGQTLAFLLACCEWGQSDRTAGAGEVVQASLARDIAERFAPSLDWLGIARPDVRRFPGVEFLTAFEQLVVDVIG